MRSIWFTSDFHLGHFNIIRYCNRPFANVLAMDEAVVDSVNDCVKPNDVLYFLEDLCLGRAEQVVAYRKRLACKTIHFIEGNHDKVARTQQSLFASWSVLSEINVAKQRIVVCHYAMRVCESFCPGSDLMTKFYSSAPLHAAHQWQSRTIHPDRAAGVGLRLFLSELSRTNRVARAMAA